MSVDRVRKVEGGLREGVEVEGEGCGYKVGVVIKGTDQSKRSSTRRRSAKAWRGAEVGRVLAVQKPVLACSSVTGSFGLCGRGKPASVGGGYGSGREHAAPSVCSEWEQYEMVARSRCLQNAGRVVLSCGSWQTTASQGRPEWVDRAGRRDPSVSATGTLPLCLPWRFLPALLFQLLWLFPSSCFLLLAAC